LLVTRHTSRSLFNYERFEDLEKFCHNNHLNEEYKAYKERDKCHHHGDKHLENLNIFTMYNNISNIIIMSNYDFASSLTPRIGMGWSNDPKVLKKTS
jgi:hypothetical protein